MGRLAAAPLLLLGIGLSLVTGSPAMAVGLAVGGIASVGFVGNLARRGMAYVDETKMGEDHEGVGPLTLILGNVQIVLPFLLGGALLAVIGQEYPVVDLLAGVLIAFGVTVLSMEVAFTVAYVHRRSP
jgi:hypothetical protein